MEHPKKLYKYRQLNERTEDIIRNNRIWFSKPADLNDPFDCQLFVEFNASEEQLYAYTRETLGNDVPDSLVDLLMQQSRDNYSDLMSSMLSKSKIMIEHETSILCLSVKPNDILMFAHYADCHRGLCLEFTLNWEDEIGKVFSVRYGETYPKLDYFAMRQSGSELVEKLLLSKFSDWSYEQEFRVLRFKQAPGLVPFRDDALTGIIFGCLVSEKDKAKVKQWNLDRSAPCTLYQALVSKTEYRLEIIPLNEAA